MSEFSTLPALRHLTNLADIRPVIVVDSREQSPLPFRRLDFVRGTLQTGDYSGLGTEDVFAVERKTVADLVSCVTGGRERFERELHRLRGFRFKRLLVVGSRADIRVGHYRSKVAPASVLNSLAAWEVRFDLPVIFTRTPEIAGELIETWVYWFAREVVQNTNDLLRGHLKTGMEIQEAENGKKACKQRECKTSQARPRQDQQGGR